MSIIEFVVVVGLGLYLFIGITGYAVVRKKSARKSIVCLYGLLAVFIYLLMMTTTTTMMIMICSKMATLLATYLSCYVLSVCVCVQTTMAIMT